MTDCIFCKIVTGEIPASKIYEDAHTLAFLDITQVTPGHTLVIPKHHVTNLLDMDDETAQQIFAAIPKIAQRLTSVLEAPALNLINNSGEVAGQTVFHAHFHLLPRFGESDGLNISFETQTPDFGQLEHLANKLRLEDEA